MKKENRNEKAKNIYLFYGQEKYDIEKAVQNIKKKFDNLTDGINLFYVNSDNIDKLNSICQNVTFFGDQKLVVIKDTKLKFDFDKMCESMSDGTTVVIVESDIDKRTSEYKKIKKQANIEEFNQLKPVEMTNYIIQILKKYDLKISKSDAEYMVNVCGNDKQNNINELHKLVIYCKDSTDIVNKDIIDKICVKTLNAKIFDMLDKAVNKDKYQAINDLDNLLMQKESIVKIYIMLYRQIMQMYLIKILKNAETKNIDEVLKIHPFVYRKLNYSCDKYSINDLKHLLYLFDEYDQKTKLGDIDFVIGLKEIICQM